MLLGARLCARNIRARWQAVKRHLATKSTWPNVNQLNGSGWLSQDLRLRRVGWSVICMEQGGTIKEVCMRRVQRRQTVPRAGPMAVVIIAHRVSMSGLCEVRVDAKYLLTSMAHPVRGNKRGIDGELWMHVFVARDSKPQSSTLVTRVWKRHFFTAKELDVGCWQHVRG